MARTRSYRRSNRRRYGRRQRFSRASMWKTALSTHEGTSLSRFTDVTSYPISVDNSIAFYHAFRRDDSSHTLMKVYGRDPYDLNSITTPSFPNWSLPEYYAFRDGLHIRAVTPISGANYTVFTPAPGPVLGDPTPWYRKDPMEKDYTSSYAGKVVNVAPGTLWNVWERYAGIERGHARGQREGRSILSLGLDLNFTLTPACLNIPVVGVSDSAASVATATGNWSTNGGNTFKWGPPAANTSYVMPTWAMVLVYSYRSAAKEFVDPDDVEADTPAHHTNTLAWIKNRNAHVQHDSTGARTLQPAECYMGRLGSVASGFYRPGIDPPESEPALVADYNVPYLRSSPIRRPEDVMIDTSKVVVHSYRVVNFPNQATALRDSETTLEHRWATGHQFDWEYASGVPYAASGARPVPGTVGSGQPPTVDPNGYTQLIGEGLSDRNPGILSLQRAPRVYPKTVSIKMRFNGKRIDFDDDQDDELEARAIVMGATNMGGDIVDQDEAAAIVATRDEAGLETTVAHNTQAADMPAVPVVRARMYSDNTAYNNVYATVISPCYKVPVGQTATASTDHTSSAFQIPNWGAVPVKVSMSTNFSFKR